MKLRSLIILTAAMLLLPTTLWAQTVVLVHGFQANGMEWRMHGVTPVLQQYGWADGGHSNLTPQGIFNPVVFTGKPERVFYTVDLPPRAPILAQAEVLDAYLQNIYAQRQEPLTLVGHSAGGVVARSWLLRPQHVPAEALITIASPHIGTPLADWSKLANRSPIDDFIAEIGFSQWTDPKGLYQDLEPEKPGNFLYWLNHQVHPTLRYVSLVRKNDIPSPDRFDYIVPPASQDMNHVFALFGQVDVIHTQGSHFLGIPDGYTLATVLARLTANGG